MDKKTILVFIQYFYPGQKSGGPAKSIYSIVKFLNKYCDFKIITSNQDIGEETQYSIDTNTWLNIYNAQCKEENAGETNTDTEEGTIKNNNGR